MISVARVEWARAGGHKIGEKGQGQVLLGLVEQCFTTFNELGHHLGVC